MIRRYVYITALLAAALGLQPVWSVETGQAPAPKIGIQVVGQWAATGPMAKQRYYGTATMLPSGKVLVTGGYDSNRVYSKTAETYDPITGLWAAAAPMSVERYDHTATLLPSGQVLVVGGYDANSIALSSSELYDPSADTWSSAGSMGVSRYGHTATLLNNGKVLIAGGYDGSGYDTQTMLFDPSIPYAPTATPPTSPWSYTGSMVHARYNHTATQLVNGQVLVAGGYDGGAVTITELYDPALGTWSLTSTPLSQARYGHTATLLASGQVLVAGGQDGSVPTNIVELYDPTAGTWSFTGNLIAARDGHTATKLANGKVLVAGGYTLSSVEMYDPSTGKWSSASPMGKARYIHTATLLSTGRVLAAGGYDGVSQVLSSAELYDTGLVVLNVGTSGSGAGTVVSTPAGISCGATCSGVFSKGSSVTLAATPNSNSVFTGWTGGGCSGTASCVVTMDIGKMVTATFIPVTAPTATTDATLVTSYNWAKMYGTVTPNGATTSVLFDIASTTNYGATSAASPSSVAALASSTPITSTKTGLWCNYTYHYRIRATNSAGVGVGQDRTLTTAACVIPTVTTQAATGTTITGTTLNGIVNGNGATTTVTFNYGLTTAYGTNLAATPSSLAPALGDTAVKATLSGLTCNSTYHYQVKAVNVAGPAVGADMTFTTAACVVPTVTTVAATNATITGATLNGTVNGNGNGIATTTSFNYGLTAAYGTNVPATPASLAAGTSTTSNIAATISGLICNTTYHYQAQAINSVGPATGVDMTVTTAACVAPTVVTTVATGVTFTGATLNGTVNGNGNGIATTTSFNYGLTTNYGTNVPAIPASLAAGTTNTNPIAATLSGLACSTLYHYQAKAINSVGPATGADMTFTTVTCLKPTVTTTAATNVTVVSATLNGTVNDNGTAVTNVSFDYGTTTSYGITVTAIPGSLPANGGSKAVSYSFGNNLVCNTTYHYRVKATNSGGLASGLDVSFKTLPCTITDITLTLSDGVANVKAGDTLTYTAVVKNIGPSLANLAVLTIATPASVPNLTVTGVTCANAKNSAACPVITAPGTGTQAFTIPTLPVTGEVTFTITATVNATATGTIAYSASLMVPNGVLDSNIANNAVIDTDRVTRLADLVITGIVLNPASPIDAYGTFSANITVKNQGAAVADGAYLDVWANSSAAPACGDEGDNWADITNLAAGASVTLTVNGLPSGVVGSKTLLAFVDSACEVSETNETNNQSTQSYTVQLPAP